LIFPGEEDYGLVPLEVQASGRPVIAYGKGGALETVAGGKTGIFFGEQTVKSLTEAVNRFENTVFDKQAIIEHVKPFGEEIFKEKLKAFIDERYAYFKENTVWDKKHV
jgi:glycosyltransferase involved in cell wall biosynthesis